MPSSFLCCGIYRLYFLHTGNFFNLALLCYEAWVLTAVGPAQRLTAELEIADSITGTRPISLPAEFSHDKRKMMGKKETSASTSSSGSSKAREKRPGDEVDLCRSRRVLSCSRRPHLYPKLIGFQNRFRFLWNVSALLRLHAGNF